jgi:hypothetical protein
MNARAQVNKRFSCSSPHNTGDVATTEADFYEAVAKTSFPRFQYGDYAVSTPNYFFCELFCLSCLARYARRETGSHGRVLTLFAKK